MRILRVEVARVPMGLVEPYTIAYEHVESAENVFVQIVTDGPHVGLGCAAPDAGVTGETHDACAAALSQAAEALEGRDATRRWALLSGLEEQLAERPAAHAALDMALHDLLAKRADLPLYHLLGGYRDRMETSVTVFLARPEEMAEKAKTLVALGVKALKLKGGRSVGDDVAAVRQVRAAVGGDVELRLDANQGYTAEEALELVTAVGHELELLEQPTRRGAAEALRAVTEGAAIPVMADESMQSLADAWRLARGEVIDMANVKLMKVGGIDAATAIAGIARAAQLELMVGCMDESALAIAAGLAFALSRPIVRYADLDGHLDLKDDPADGAVVFHDGLLHPMESAGLGLRRLDSVFG